MVFEMTQRDNPILFAPLTPPKALTGFKGPAWPGKFGNRSQRAFSRYTVYYAIYW